MNGAPRGAAPAGEESARRRHGIAAALGRVVIFDVWKQETIYRVLTFTALGVVLIVVSFIYNKYQEKIRQWL